MFVLTSEQRSERDEVLPQRSDGSPERTQMAKAKVDLDGFIAHRYSVIAAQLESG